MPMAPLPNDPPTCMQYRLGCVPRLRRFLVRAPPTPPPAPTEYMVRLHERAAFASAVSLNLLKRRSPPPIQPESVGKTIAEVLTALLVQGGAHARVVGRMGWMDPGGAGDVVRAA